MSNTTANPLANPKYREQMQADMQKAVKNFETIERANAHFRKFPVTVEGIKQAYAYLTSMMPKHWEAFHNCERPKNPVNRYGYTSGLEIWIRDNRTGFANFRRVYGVIDNHIMISSRAPRFVKRAFAFQLKQDQDYLLRFKNRDQEHYNELLTKR